MKKRRNRTHVFYNKYAKNNLFTYYVKGLISILIIPFLIFYIIFIISGLHSAKEEFRYKSTEILTRNVNIFDNMFKSMFKNFESLSGNKYVQDFLSDGFFTYNKAYISADNINSDILNICSSLVYLDSIHIYSSANDYFISSINSGFSKNFYDKACLDIYKNYNKNGFITYRSHDNNYLLTLCYIINPGTDSQGAVFFNIDINKLKPTLLSENIETGTIFLSDSRNNIVFSSDNNNFLQLNEKLNVKYNEYKQYKTKSDVFMTTGLNNEDVFLIYGVSKHEYLTAFYPFIKNTILYFIFMLIALLLLSVAGTFKLYNSVQKAFADIKLPTDANHDNSEYLFLTGHMMSNVEENKDAEKNLSEKIHKLKKYQALALQTQINPHFLFNSLNLISSYALEEGNEDSPMVMIIDKLSDILRFSLNTKNYIIKFSEELEATKKYIDIENIKHDNTIDFRFNIDPLIYDFYTLKMILQPIIENSISHGVKLLRHEKGFVEINAVLNEKNIVVTIINNGPEIDAQKLKNLQESLLSTEDIPENKHIGLRNVNQRIKLIFGNNYGCTIDSADSITTVTLTIPIIAKNTDNFELYY